MTRLPALPLITADPYFSVWMPADKLTDTDTAHWCGTKQPICGFATIDGQKLRFLGAGATPAMPTSDITMATTVIAVTRSLKNAAIITATMTWVYTDVYAIRIVLYSFFISVAIA